MDWVQIFDLSPTIGDPCSRNVVSQSSLLQNGKHKNSSFIEMLWEFNDIVYKCIWWKVTAQKRIVEWNSSGQVVSLVPGTWQELSRYSSLVSSFSLMKKFRHNVIESWSRSRSWSGVELDAEPMLQASQWNALYPTWSFERSRTIPGKMKLLARQLWPVL